MSDCSVDASSGFQVFDDMHSVLDWWSRQLKEGRRGGAGGGHELPKAAPRSRVPVWMRGIRVRKHGGVGKDVRYVGDVEGVSRRAGVDGGGEGRGGGVAINGGMGKQEEEEEEEEEEVEEDKVTHTKPLCVCVCVCTYACVCMCVCVCVCVCV